MNRNEFTQNQERWLTALESGEYAQLKLLRRPDVEARCGIGRSTIYDWMKRGKFPQPVKLGPRAVAWRESDVIAWLESRKDRPLP